VLRQVAALWSRAAVVLHVCERERVGGGAGLSGALARLLLVERGGEGAAKAVGDGAPAVGHH
jgi:hypothetical protein